MGITACDLRVTNTGMSPMGDRPMYEFPLEEHRGDSDRMKSSLSDEIEASELINEEL